MNEHGPRRETDAPAWDPRVGRRFVTPHEWHASLPVELLRRMSVSVVAEALADAADEHGVILNFVEATFYHRHVARVLNRELAGDEVVEPLTFDRYAALALTDAVNALTSYQLLAVGGHDNTLHYRLTLPDSVQGGRVR